MSSPAAAVQAPPQTAIVAPLSTYHDAIYTAIDHTKAYVAAYWGGLVESAVFWALVGTVATLAYVFRPDQGYPAFWRDLTEASPLTSALRLCFRALARLPSALRYFSVWFVVAMLVLFYISPSKPDNADRYKIAQFCVAYQNALEANEVGHFASSQQTLSDRETYELIDQCWQRTRMSDRDAYDLYATAVKDGFMSQTGQLYYGRNFDPYLGFREFAQPEKP